MSVSEAHIGHAPQHVLHCGSNPSDWEVSTWPPATSNTRDRAVWPCVHTGPEAYTYRPPSVPRLLSTYLYLSQPQWDYHRRSLCHMYSLWWRAGHWTRKENYAVSEERRGSIQHSAERIRSRDEGEPPCCALRQQTENCWLYLWRRQFCNYLVLDPWGRSEPLSTVWLSLQACAVWASTLTSVTCDTVCILLNPEHFIIKVLTC